MAATTATTAAQLTARQELREIYQKSSLGHDTAAAAAASSAAAAARDDHDGSRKPVQGDCPVCFMEFEPAHEEIVWCRAQCGQNIHKVCFERWAASQRQSGGVRCVYWWVSFFSFSG